MRVNWFLNSNIRLSTKISLLVCKDRLPKTTLPLPGLPATTPRLPWHACRVVVSSFIRKKRIFTYWVFRKTIERLLWARSFYLESIHSKWFIAKYRLQYHKKLYRRKSENSRARWSISWQYWFFYRMANCKKIHVKKFGN